jgi:hypothetical protein
MSDLRDIRAAIANANKSLEKLLVLQERIKLLREARQSGDYRMTTSNGISEPLPQKIGKDMIVALLEKAEQDYDDILLEMRGKLLAAADVIVQ